jgi:hypothetical protein
MTGISILALYSKPVVLVVAASILNQPLTNPAITHKSPKTFLLIWRADLSVTSTT